jgi:hypothetical protein
LKDFEVKLTKLVNTASKLVNPAENRIPISAHLYVFKPHAYMQPIMISTDVNRDIPGNPSTATFTPLGKKLPGVDKW